MAREIDEENVSVLTEDCENCEATGDVVISRSYCGDGEWDEDYDDCRACDGFGKVALAPVPAWMVGPHALVRGGRTLMPDASGAWREVTA